MISKRTSSFLFSMSFILIATIAEAQFYNFETANFKIIYYSKAQDYLIPHVARCLENALQFHRGLFDYTPAEKTTILLEDVSDFGNGGADAVPGSIIHAAIAPFSYVYETMPGNERMNWMMNHEMAHVVTMDQAASRDRFFRRVFFGKVPPQANHPVSVLYSYLTNPRRYAPRWYFEGSAVFLETWMAGGLGRALGAYDEMVFRTMVRDRSFFYDLVGLESEGTAIDFQVGVNSYLYGTRFMSFLAYQHSPEKLLQWLARSQNSKSFFAAQFKSTFGTSIDHAWSQWNQFELEFQRANLDSIRAHPVTPARPVTALPLGSVSRAYYDAGAKKIYAAINYPGQLPHIAALDLDMGTVEKICDVKGGALYYVTSLAYDPKSNTLFYVTENSSWRDLRALDLKTRRSWLLIKDVRTGDLTFNPADRSLWGVCHFNGISTIVRIPEPYKEWNQVYSWPYGKDVFDLDISPDGTILTMALTEVSGRQKLIKMDTAKLLAGDDSHEVIFDFENSTPANFVFSGDGRFLFGSSYYSGVSNIYRYSFEKNEMEIISNCETGLFRPVPVSNDSLIAMSYTGNGFVPVMIPNRVPKQVGAIRFLGNEIARKHPVVREWIAGSPGRINLDSLSAHTTPYGILRNVRLNSAYPIVEGYKDYAAVGGRFLFTDNLRVSGLDLTASYTPAGNLPDDERIHLGLAFNYRQWKLSAKYNGADFYDLFGPTKTSRKGYSLALQYKKSLLYEVTPSDNRTFDYALKLAGYGGLESLPDFQNVSASFEEAASFEARMDYQYLRRSLGAVDDEKGVKWQLISHNNYVNAELFPLVHTNLDYGIPLPLNHSAIWLRGSAGNSFGDRNDPFGNFYFGGFGNNWVDFQSVKRFREYYSFPGVELNEVGGANYGKMQLEWILPPLRFRRLGFLNLYCRWARLSLFSSGIMTNLDRDSSRRSVLDAGAQLDFQIILFSTFKSAFSFGYGLRPKTAASRRKNSWSRGRSWSNQTEIHHKGHKEHKEKRLCDQITESKTER